MKKRMETILGAFEKDTFDAKKVDPVDGKKVRTAMEQRTKLVAQIVPILKPEQCEKLAVTMDRGPAPHGGRAGHRPAMDADDDE